MFARIELNSFLQIINCSCFTNFIFIYFLTSDFEASFIRLLDRVTNGSTIEINQTGESYNKHVTAELDKLWFVL